MPNRNAAFSKLLQQNSSQAAIKRKAQANVVLLLYKLNFEIFMCNSRTVFVTENP